MTFAGIKSDRQEGEELQSHRKETSKGDQGSLISREIHHNSWQSIICLLCVCVQIQ